MNTKTDKKHQKIHQQLNETPLAAGLAGQQRVERRGDRDEGDDSDDGGSPLRLLSREQVMRLIGGISYPTIWHWIRAGKFPRGREVGGRTMWLASDIAAWIEARPVRMLKGDDAKKEEA